MKVKLLSRVRLFVTPWTLAHEAPPSMGFSRQEYWSELPFPSVISHKTWFWIISSSSQLLFENCQTGWTVLRKLSLKNWSQKKTLDKVKFGLGVQNKKGQRLTEFCQENALVIANTLFQQHKRRLYTWTSLYGQHWNQIDYILFSQRWRSSIQSAKTRPGAACGSDHELLIVKFRLKLKKIWKNH